MVNFDDIATENIKEHNPNWPQCSYYLHRTLKICGSGSGKTVTLITQFNKSSTYYQ